MARRADRVKLALRMTRSAVPMVKIALGMEGPSTSDGKIGLRTRQQGLVEAEVPVMMVPRTRGYRSS